MTGLRHDVAHRVDIRSTYTYIVEMLMQLAAAGVPMTFIPVRVSGMHLRPSRLIKSNAEYLFKTSCTIFDTLARRHRRWTGQVVLPEFPNAVGESAYGSGA